MKKKKICTIVNAKLMLCYCTLSFRKKEIRAMSNPAELVFRLLRIIGEMNKTFMGNGVLNDPSSVNLALNTQVINS